MQERIDIEDKPLISDTKSYGLILTKEELVLLTGHKRRNAQAKELDILHITFRPRADGSLVVLREHVNRQLGLAESKETPVVRKFKINMDAINAKSSPAKK